MTREEGLYTVGEVARLAHVTVRTLHHYHQLGLLGPAARTEAGYRLYTAEDLARLQTVLFYRELGFPWRRSAGCSGSHLRSRACPALAARSGGGTDTPLRGHARSHRQDIGFPGRGYRHDERRDVRGLRRLRSRGVRGRRSGALGRDRRLQGVGAAQPLATPRKTGSGSRPRATRSNTASRLLDGRGCRPRRSAPMDAVDTTPPTDRSLVLPGSREMHVGLGEMYVADPRFTAHYDKVRPGMAQYVCDAIEANLERDSGGCGGPGG